MRSTSTAERGPAVAGTTGMRLRDLDGHVYETDSSGCVSRIVGTSRSGVDRGDVFKVGDPDAMSREAAVLERLGGFAAPLLRPLGLSLLAGFIMLLTTELGFLQKWLDTVALTGGQWLVCAGLALVFAIAVELDKKWQRHQTA